MPIQFGMPDEAINPFGTLSGWSWLARLKDKKRTLTAPEDHLGNDVYYHPHGDRTEYQIEGNATGAANVSPVLPTHIGKVYEDEFGVCTKIEIKTSRTEFVKITAEMHQHDANAHTDASVKSVAHGVMLGRNFGATDVLGLGTADVLCKECTITIECDHVDESDHVDGHAVGQNTKPRITVQAQYVGVPDTATLPIGYVLEAAPIQEKIGEFIVTTVTAKKPLAFG